MNNGSTDAIHDSSSSSAHSVQNAPPNDLSISIDTTPTSGTVDNPTAAGFDTGPSFSEARKAFLNRANNPPQQQTPSPGSATSPNADSLPRRYSGTGSGIPYRKQSSGQHSNRNSAILEKGATTNATTASSNNTMQPPQSTTSAMPSTSPRNSLYEHMGKAAGASSAFEPVGKLKSTESSGGKNYSNGDSGFIEPSNTTPQGYPGSGVNFKRENSDSTINSDLESVAPQSSVYSADLDGRQGSEMTINSGQFSINSSISSTPLHVGMGGTRLNKMQSSTEQLGANDVGLRELSNQIRRRYVRDGFRFNIMVVGETGLGKSTFVNTLFHSTIYSNSTGSGDGSDGSSQQQKNASSHVLQSPNERWCKVVKDHAEKQPASAATNAATGSKPKSSYSTSASKGPSNPLVTPLSKLTASSTSPRSDEKQTAESSSDLSQWSVNDFQCLVSEGDSKMTLGLIDTPGFGHFLDNSKCSEPLVEYINKQFDNYMTIESQIDRASGSNKENMKPPSTMATTLGSSKAASDDKGKTKSSAGLNTKLENDPRVHCCLYFLSPQNPNRLKAVDIEAMKNVGERVNLIPVIAKADTLTPEELKAFKQMVLSEIATHDIKVFQIPEPTALQQQLDPELAQENKKYKALSPFAVCGSTVTRSDGARVREYPFGTVEIENESHNDFVALRSILMQIHTWNLIDATRELHYEKYRSSKLASSIGGGGSTTPGATTGGKDSSSKALGSSSAAGGGGVNNNKGPLAILGEEKRAHEERLAKMQEDMQRVFEQKVAEKERRLRVKEDEMMRKHEEMRQNLEAQQAALAAAREQHERNLQAWTESTAAAAAAASANQNAATLGYPGEAENNANYGTLKDKKKKLFGR